MAEQKIEAYTNYIHKLDVVITDSQGQTVSITLPKDNFKELSIAPGAYTIKIIKYKNSKIDDSNLFSQSEIKLDINNDSYCLEFCGSQNRIVVKPHFEISPREKMSKNQ
jgi:hypothetical protein